MRKPRQSPSTEKPAYADTHGGRLPPRLEPDPWRRWSRRLLLFAPALLGMLALGLLIPLITAVFTGGAREALVAATIGGFLALLVNLVVQYVGKLVEQLRDEDRQYRREMAVLMPLLMEMTDAAVVFRGNLTHKTFQRASTRVWDIAQMQLGEFWHPTKMFDVGAAYASIRGMNEVIAATERHSYYPEEIKSALLKCADEIEAARKTAGAEPIRWTPPIEFEVIAHEGGPTSKRADD